MCFLSVNLMHTTQILPLICFATAVVRIVFALFLALFLDRENARENVFGVVSK